LYRACGFILGLVVGILLTFVPLLQQILSNPGSLIRTVFFLISHPPLCDGLGPLACFFSELILKLLWRRDRLLGKDLETNNGIMQPIFTQRIGKHIPASTNTHTKIELLLETVFNWGDQVSC
jgi:hypothetical protein